MISDTFGCCNECAKIEFLLNKPIMTHRVVMGGSFALPLLFRPWTVLFCLKLVQLQGAVCTRCIYAYSSLSYQILAIQIAFDTLLILHEHSRYHQVNWNLICMSLLHAECSFKSLLSYVIIMLSLYILYILLSPD